MRAKTEVFIPYGPDDNVQSLGDTLENWNIKKYEPIAIRVKDTSNDRLIHIAAEAIAKGDYIIAKIGSRPELPPPTLKKGSIKVEACQPRVH